MARTAAGGQLTQLHRHRQLVLRAAALRELLALWPMFNLDDIDRSWGPLETALMSLIALRRRDSAGLAVNYYRAIRTAEVGGETAPRIAPPPDPVKLAATLRIQGPILAKKNILVGKNPASTTLTRVAGVVSKQVLDGGRETLRLTGMSDTRQRGWQRVTSGDPCDWCASQAAAADAGDGAAAFGGHDHCGCEPAPVFV